MSAAITVIGIGADGFAGLGATAREALASAPLVVGSARQLDLLPAGATASAERRLPWPSPLEPLLDELSAGRHGDAVVLASGDPMLHGIGASFARRLIGAAPHLGAADSAGPAAPADAAAPAHGAASTDAAGHERDVAAAVTLHVIPHPSAFALACARLGWPAADTELLSTVARAPELVARALQPGRRLVVYATGAQGAAEVARVLVERGWGPSRFVVLEQLGGPGERLVEATAETWGERAADPLHAVAIETRAARGTRPLATTPGLPDDAFDHDGQLTKRHVRAVTLAALAPMPGELLWDVGAGNGSIAIEWLRAVAGTRAVAFEANAERAARIAANAYALGVPELRVVQGRAPEALTQELVAALEADGGASDARPDVIFIGGGLTTPGLLDIAWGALRLGGRLVANAVTLESQARLLEARAAHGGTLTQIAIAHAEPIGSFSGWRQQMPVVQWEARKLSAEREQPRASESEENPNP